MTLFLPANDIVSNIRPLLQALLPRLDENNKARPTG